MASRRSRSYRVSLQAEAIDDLDSIYSFISRDSTARAKGFTRELKKKIISLNSMPRRGTRVKILEDDGSLNQIRFIEHRGYLIFYTILEKEVVVLHVTGPGQDWMRLFL